MLLVKTKYLQKALLLGLVLGIWSASCLAQASLSMGRSLQISLSVRNDVSTPLRDLPTEFIATEPASEVPLRMPHKTLRTSTFPDSVRQTVALPSVSTIMALNFTGVGVGLGSFIDCCTPPDANGAVGASQYVQWVNKSLAVFDKSSGALISGPVNGKRLWAGFGGPCSVYNSGDPIAQYDKIAQRWVLAQPVTASGYYMYCVAVSVSSDATGSYHRYAFAMPDLPDYPKLGVWPDAYYVSFNLFSGSTFLGAMACALDRLAMLAGLPATQICFTQPATVASLLPSDLDGTLLPPSGSPAYFLNLGTNALNLWTFHADFANPSNATFTGPTVIAVAPFTEACGGKSCIPQFGLTQKLESLGDRVMYRLAYRRFTDGHESLLANHTVFVSGTQMSQVDGVRWYEIRDPGGNPTMYQQGTFAPDTNSRWMASLAMDKVGDIALGYSVSSTAMHPSIRYTGRSPTDFPGTMQGETSLMEGGGSQTQGRWGDYTSMSIDPVDDCTFWYTNEYLQTTGKFNWSTRIAAFKFPGCQ